MRGQDRAGRMRRAFTMVELLATLGMISALGVCVFQLVATSSQVARDHDERLAVMLLTENLAEVFRGVAYDEVPQLVEQQNTSLHADGVRMEHSAFEVNDLPAWHIKIAVQRDVRGRLARAEEHVYVVQASEDDLP